MPLKKSARMTGALDDAALLQIPHSRRCKVMARPVRAIRLRRLAGCRRHAHIRARPLGRTIVL